MHDHVMRKLAEALEGHKQVAVLATKCREGGWKAVTGPVEVSSHGFNGFSTLCLLQERRSTGAHLCRTTKVCRGGREKQLLVLAEKEEYELGA